MLGNVMLSMTEFLKQSEVGLWAYVYIAISCVHVCSVRLCNVRVCDVCVCVCDCVCGGTYLRMTWRILHSPTACVSRLPVVLLVWFGSGI